MDTPYDTRDEQFESADPFIDPLLARIDARFDLFEARMDALFDQFEARFDQFEARLGATIDRGFRRLLVTMVSIMVLGFAVTITAVLLF